MLHLQVEDYRVLVGGRFAISFQRTLRLPDDGKTYPLPPTLGCFPVQRVEDFASSFPFPAREKNGVFIPMYQREALWLAFEAANWKPNAVKIGVGRVNALTGKGWDARLHARPQDYLVCPEQPWLDGIITGEGMIRQFVAMPLGKGYTVEAQLTGREEFGGLQALVFEPLPGRFPDQPPPQPPLSFQGPPGMSGLGAPASPQLAIQAAPAAQMGLGAGGRMRQKIYPDPYGLDTWDQDDYGELNVYIVNSLVYQRITGKALPPSPVSARTYTEYGLPWFDIYDEEKGALATSEELASIRSVAAIDAQRNLPEAPEETPLDIDSGQVQKLDLEQDQPRKSDLP